MTSLNTIFPADYHKIVDRIDALDPITYGRTRNFADGAVSHFSPYISRGVISTRFVYERLIAKNYDPREMQKFIQELAWRDYFQRIWQEKGDMINHDLKHIQAGVTNQKIPCAVINAQTGVELMDDAIKSFYETGYMHNHMRMYVAFVACNIGGSHWRVPAKWFRQFNPREFYFREHPLNRFYNGIEEPREWHTPIEGYFPSFFAFWKKK